MSEHPQFSVVIPSYDEEPNIGPLAERLTATFAKMGVESWEIIWVENGSSDGSLELLEGLHQKDPRYKYLSLSRNFGHSGAVACGLDHADGEFVVLMDGDLQDPPEMIADFFEKLEKDDLDVVYGQRLKRAKEGFIKRTSMKIFYRLWRRTAYIHVPLDAGNFCLMRRGVVNALCSMRERGRFVPGLRAFVGFKQDGIAFDRPGRAAGEEKTNFWILSGIAIEGLLAFSVFPLRLLMILGMGAMVLAVIASLLLLIGNWTNVLDMGNDISYLSAFMVLVSGATMMGLGVIGEYVGRIYAEVKQRPIYVVRRRGV
ncbi:MAG: glycosyltransferase family 2 protein [Planctomycetes bacterium]|nr:glycosyltransferase family 2 protein [Planctomycetota bacterium]MCP4770194.1 glycosyltransferase family 2 protein [Planctomycetota bacterium]MCP4860658.1 glycosyltransferase family 2 protein [Planctomycetota bacterium]